MTAAQDPTAGLTVGTTPTVTDIPSQESAKYPVIPNDRPKYYGRPPRRPLTPEFHGAWLGGLGGVTVGSIIVGLFQTYLNHGHPLPAIDIQAIDGVCAAAVAALGSWLAHVTKGIL